MKTEFEVFSNQVQHVHWLWCEYSSLYRGGDVAVKLELMNQAARNFFYLVQQSWLDELFLSVGRLLDRSTVCGETTVGVNYVFEQISDNVLEQKARLLRDEMKALYDAGVKSWRNQRIAHNDLKSLLRQKTLPDVPLGDLESLVMKLEIFANLISAHYYDEQCGYSQVTVIAGAEKLLRVLRDGMMHKARQTNFTE